ncbi:MAG: hypothetical protein GY820_47280 [Gammaproteobacteria bacterium]|nr:hypothetical protein [Gammaproteobacteria bacterium]
MVFIRFMTASLTENKMVRTLTPTIRRRKKKLATLTVSFLVNNTNTKRTKVVMVEEMQLGTVETVTVFFSYLLIATHGPLSLRH